jgi:alpha-tubulin suppressor-like RCC1 family protein
VLGLGDNRNGQLGIGSTSKDKQMLTSPTSVDLSDLAPGSKAIAVSAGAEFSVIVADDGAVFTFGLPEFGQLGHGEDGKYFVTSSKLAFHLETTPRKVATLSSKNVHVIDVQCGANSSVALDKEGKIWTWGHGGHGRTGHNNSPNDEMRPRCVEKLGDTVRSVYAGATAHFAVSKHNQTYMWGQTKKSGDSILYPKPLTDLFGLKVRSISCGPSSTIVAADDSVVTWGPSPCYGELGYGDKCPQKSSTKPQYVSACNNLHAIQVGMGQAFSIILVRNEVDSDKEIIERLPVFGTMEEGDDLTGDDQADVKAEAEGDDDDEEAMDHKQVKRRSKSEPKTTGKSNAAPRKRKAASSPKEKQAKAAKPTDLSGPSARSKRALGRK